MREQVPSRPLTQVALEASALAAAGTLLALQASRSLDGGLSGASWAALVLALPTGVLAADLASGLVHWLGDRFFREQTPVLGPMLIEPFRAHHRDPADITTHGPLELHGNSCFPVVALLALALAWPPDPDSLWRRFADASVTGFALAAMATNQVHCWAHAPRVPGWVAMLQRRRLILSPDAHARHHSGDFQQSYCITTGWWNPLLDHTRALPRLERWLRALRAWRS